MQARFFELRDQAQAINWHAVCATLDQTGLQFIEMSYRLRREQVMGLSQKPRVEYRLTIEPNLTEVQVATLSSVWVDQHVVQSERTVEDRILWRHEIKARRAPILRALRSILHTAGLTKGGHVAVIRDLPREHHGTAQFDELHGHLVLNTKIRKIQPLSKPVLVPIESPLQRQRA